MRFFTASKILFATTLALAPMLHAVSAEATTATSTSKLRVVAQARTETSTRLDVKFTVDGRALRLIGDRSNPSATHLDVVDGGRVLLSLRAARDGSVSVTNHLGRTYSQSQLEADPALFDTFDPDALVALDPTIARYLVTGQGGTSAGPNPGCFTNPWIALACGAAAFVVACDPWLSCDWSGCEGGFDCGGNDDNEN